MAIIQSTDNDLVTTQSDSGKYVIREDGIRYEIAIDPVNSGRTYTESDESLPAEISMNA